MGVEFSKEVLTIANAVQRRASECGRPGSEAYLMAVARESLSCAGFDEQLVPERSQRDSIVAEMVEAADGLVLFEIEYIWAICRAMARSKTEWRAALVQPFHVHVPSRHIVFAAPGVDRKDSVRFRGAMSVDLEDWRAFVDGEALFAKVFSAALSGVSDRFAGMVETVKELTALAGDGRIGQARIVVRSSRDAWYDPVGELQATDALWAAARSLGRRGTDIVAWQSADVNGRGYDISHLRGDHESLSGFEGKGLHKVIQLPEDEQTQLFVWDGSYVGPVEMTDMRNGARKTVTVSPAELRLRLDYTPSHYPSGSAKVTMATLGSLVRKIQRGTKVNGKDLKVICSASEPRPGASLDIQTMTYRKEDDLYYVDNASIAGGVVKPRVIAEIPEGQDRYTITPEDGTVLLVARNGKGFACYTAKCPTLVSNNLFIVWPDPEKAAAEYLSCAMRSVTVCEQLDTMRVSMGRADLEGIVVPVGRKRFMDAVVERERQITNERARLEYELQLLSVEDPLDQLWVESGDGDSGNITEGKDSQ